MSDPNLLDRQPLPYPIAAPAAPAAPPEWAELREHCPAARIQLPSGDEATLVTRYADVRNVLADPRFTRDLAAPDAARIGDAEQGGPFDNPMARDLFADGHQRWRRMVGRWFTAKRMASLRPGMEAMAEKLVDGMLEQGAPADLVQHVAFPFPAWVICTMLGAPDRDRQKFADWADTLLALSDIDSGAVGNAREEFAAYVTGLVEAKRVQPGEDLISELLSATDAEGRPMSDEALVATAQALLIGGLETTAGAIAKGVATLLADRRHWERLVADPSLVRTAVEELLRFDPNISFGLPRYLSEDAELSDGTVLPSGDTVMCLMASANRDAAVFEGADGLDLARTPNTHLAFGAGAHSCIGQPLARTELQVMFDVLLRRLPTLELAVGAEELTRVDGLIVGRLAEVPVRW
ncbi:Linalool 8-monooxygenase [Actinobacteria bacterium OK074]|nr:Linalool 8-monooxygenase [Actinobacteria bacterium OK074]